MFGKLWNTRDDFFWFLAAPAPAPPFARVAGRTYASPSTTLVASSSPWSSSVTSVTDPAVELSRVLLAAAVGLWDDLRIDARLPLPFEAFPCPSPFRVAVRARSVSSSRSGWSSSRTADVADPSTDGMMVAPLAFASTSAGPGPALVPRPSSPGTAPSSVTASAELNNLTPILHLTMIPRLENRTR